MARVNTITVSSDAAAASFIASSIGGLAAAGSQDYASMALAQTIICQFAESSYS